MESDLAALGSLDDPVRRRLYEIVSQRHEPVGRDEAAVAAGIGRALAAYHLDKLVEAGLLTASYRRLRERSGPGAGRPAKLYARSGREIAVSVPPREYELAARLLVRAVEADRTGGSEAALHDSAHNFGVELGRQFHAGRGSTGPALQVLQSVLTEHGYEPWLADDGSLRLRNCPFHHLAQRHRDVVCDMNLALIEGLAVGVGVRGFQPTLDPQPGCCCVTIGSDPP
jgi:predicted ArsR family transcriptional regulator